MAGALYIEKGEVKVSAPGFTTLNELLDSITGSWHVNWLGQGGPLTLDWSLARARVICVYQNVDDQIRIDLSGYGPDAWMAAMSLLALGYVETAIFTPCILWQDYRRLTPSSDASPEGTHGCSLTDELFYESSVPSAVLAATHVQEALYLARRFGCRVHTATGGGWFCGRSDAPYDVTYVGNSDTAPQDYQVKAWRAVAQAVKFLTPSGYSVTWVACVACIAIMLRFGFISWLLDDHLRAVVLDLPWCVSSIIVAIAAGITISNGAPRLRPEICHNIPPTAYVYGDWPLDFKAPVPPRTRATAIQEARVEGREGLSLCAYHPEETVALRHPGHTGLHFTADHLAIIDSSVSISAQWEHIRHYLDGALDEIIKAHPQAPFMISTASLQYELPVVASACPVLLWEPSSDGTLTVRSEGLRSTIRVPLIAGSQRSLALWRLYPWFSAVQGLPSLVINGRRTLDANIERLVTACLLGVVPYSYNRATTAPAIMSGASRHVGDLSSLWPSFAHKMENYGYIYGIDECWLQNLGWYTEHPLTWVDRLQMQPPTLELDILAAPVTYRDGHFTFGALQSGWTPAAGLLHTDKTSDTRAIAVMGSRGDTVNAKYLANELGLRVVPLLSDADGLALLHLSERGTPLEALPLLGKAMREARKLPLDTIYPITLPGAWRYTFDARPAFLAAGFMSGGFAPNSPIRFAMNLLQAVRPAAIRFGGAFLTGAPRSSDGIRRIVRQSNLGLVDAAVLPGSSAIPAPPDTHMLPVITDVDHHNILRNYRRIYYAGGAGAWALGRASGCEMHAWRRHPDSDYFWPSYCEPTWQRTQHLAAFLGSAPLWHKMTYVDYMLYAVSLVWVHFPIARLTYLSTIRARQALRQSRSLLQFLGALITGLRSEGAAYNYVIGGCVIVMADWCVKTLSNKQKTGESLLVIALQLLAAIANPAAAWLGMIIHPAIAVAAVYLLTSPAEKLARELNAHLIDTLACLYTDPAEADVCIRFSPVGPLLWHADICSIKDNWRIDTELDHAGSTLTQWLKPMHFVVKETCPRTGSFFPIPTTRDRLMSNATGNWRWSTYDNCITGVFRLTAGQEIGLFASLLLIGTYLSGLFIGTILATLGLPYIIYVYCREWQRLG